jgi:asparagine N-glycosylation enzyme membrane subunit Stt3
MDERDQLNWKVFLAVFALVAGFLIIRIVYNASGMPLFGDNDDAMRMVVVRDFLGGQNWFDHTQYRMNAPFGAQMHWSRLVDLPIALLVLAATPFAGANAEMVAACIWPIILLFIFMWLTAQLTLRLVGREGILAAAVLPALSPAVMSEFSPGRIDHHSVQIILTMAMVLCTIHAMTKPRFAFGAGLAAATSIAIGTENLPIVVAGVLIFGLIYVFTPQRSAAVRNFGLSLGIGTALHLLIALPPNQWFTQYCDAISIVYVVAALAAGLGLALLSLLPMTNRPWPFRIAAGVVLGVAALALVAVLFPKCLAGPYADVDPWLVANWLSQIGEARPLTEAFAEQPTFVISVALPVLLGSIALGFAIKDSRGELRVEWIVLGCFLALATLVAMLQVRGFRIASALVIPSAAYLIVRARAHYVKAATVRSTIGLVVSWVALSGVAVALIVNGAINLLPGRPGDQIIAAATNRFVCLEPEAYVDLAGIPPERIMTPIDVGAYMLLYTHHSVVAAPYHRNTRGLIDTFDFYNKPIGEVRKILSERGISLVVTCPLMPEMRGFSFTAEDSFLRLAEKGQLPDWITDVSPPDAALKTYTVKPD